MLRLAALGLAIILTAATPASTTYDLTTTNRDSWGSTRGTIVLTLGAHGILIGYYTSYSGIDRQQIGGGEEGTDIWFDIGRTHYTGKIAKDGSISGVASTIDTEFVFTAVPEAGS